MKDETKKLIALGGVGAVAIYMLRPKAAEAGGFGGGGGAPLLPILPEETTEKAGDIIYNLPAAVETAFTGFGADVKESIAEGDITPSKKASSKLDIKATVTAAPDTDTITQRLEKFLLPGETLEGFLDTSIAASQQYPVSKKGHDVASLYFKPSTAGIKTPSIVAHSVITTRAAEKKAKKAASSSGRYWSVAGTHAPGWKQVGAREPTAPGQPDIY